jgi:hypothetical protein
MIGRTHLEDAVPPTVITRLGTGGNRPGITDKRPTARNAVMDPSKTRTRAMTSGYYRTSSPVTALPMINALDLARSFKNREACGRTRSFRRQMACLASGCQHQLSTHPRLFRAQAGIPVMSPR